MAWTNVNIIDPFDRTQELKLELKILQTKLDWAINQRDYYHKELANIFEAAKEYGYVEINIGKEAIKLIHATS